MNLLVVDTDVVSYIFRGHPLSERYVDILRDQELVISFMTRAVRLARRTLGSPPPPSAWKRPW